MRVIYAGLTSADAARLYEAWLLGERPPFGAVAASGAYLWLLPEAPVVGGADIAPGVRSALSDASRAAAALRNWQDWRRLPAGTAAAMTAEGLTLFDPAGWAPPEGTDLTLPGLLDAVLTDREGAALWSVPLTALRGELAAGRFGPWAKETPAGWLLAREPAEAVRQGTAVARPPINPLLLVFATAEAAPLWGRSADEVRSAAAGAGHRAARLGDGERRRAGRTWLVTRRALEGLYGEPIPGAWRGFADAFSGRKAD